MGDRIWHTHAILLVIGWFCIAGLPPGLAQSAESPRHHLETEIPVLISALERSPESFPTSLAPQLSRLLQQKEWHQIEALLEAYTLLEVQINPEARVKLKRGNAKRVLQVGRRRLFLVKVTNEAGMTAPLQITSPNKSQKEWLSTNIMGFATKEDTALLSGKPSGFYLLELCCRVQGLREAIFAANIGQGTQDLGFRGEVALLFSVTHPSPGNKTRARLR